MRLPLPFTPLVMEKKIHPDGPDKFGPPHGFHYICKIMGDIPGNPERRLP
jgi:hypothetical protein